jgi:hypothetical protein
MRAQMLVMLEENARRWHTRCLLQYSGFGTSRWQLPNSQRTQSVGTRDGVKHGPAHPIFLHGALFAVTLEPAASRISPTQ